jgi:hypothetical protein
MKTITSMPAKRLSPPPANSLRNPRPKMIPSYFPVKPVRLAAPAHPAKSSLREIPRASAAIRALVSSAPIAVAGAIAAAAIAAAVIEETVVDVANVVDAIAVDVPEVAPVDASNGDPVAVRVTNVAVISVPARHDVRS